MTSKSISARKYDSGCWGSEITVRESVVNLRSIPTRQTLYLSAKLDYHRRIAAASYSHSRQYKLNSGDEKLDWSEAQPKVQCYI